MRELRAVMEDCIPRDHSRQMLTADYIRRLLRDHHDVRRVMDLGCGSGRSLDTFRAVRPRIEWVGLDIADSPEARSRKRTDGRFCTFDGVRVPFADGAFDFVYSAQVFEHVRDPQPLAAEIRRVLRPGGWLAGSVAQMEAYHSYSVWNFTPYGFRMLLENAGLRLLEVRPGMDAVTLLARRLLGRPRFFDRWWARESPLNRLISVGGAIRRASPASINAAKLLAAGSFGFLATRPEQAERR